MERKRLPSISPRAWEHPADRAALSALKQVPGFDDILKFFLGMTWEKSWRLIFLASSVRVGPQQFPKVDAMVDEACRVLDVADRPEVYITQNPMLNAGAWGVRKPFITLNSSLMDIMGESEQLAVIAHEIGHILSGHVLYKNLLFLLLALSGVLFPVPVSMIVLRGVIAALTEWDRKSELSADRAGLLVVQDPDVSYRALMHMAGGKHIHQMDMDTFYAQAQEYESGGDVLDGLYKFLNLLGQSHPFAVLRLTAIRQWATEGSYQSILDGDYPTRTDHEENIANDFSEATREYREEMKRAKDPFARAVTDVAAGFDEIRKGAEEFFGSLFGGGSGPGDTGA
jgi:Zn-dependent protease with chaperone function